MQLSIHKTAAYPTQLLYRNGALQFHKLKYGYGPTVPKQPQLP